MFTEDEIVALMARARMVQAWGGLAMRDGAASALDKIVGSLPDPVRARADRVQVHAWTGLAEVAPVREGLDSIERAVDHGTSLRLTYGDEAGKYTQRVVRPLGLWFWGKVWTLVAWCELRQAFRMLRVDRIGTIETLDRFTPEPGQTLVDFYATQVRRHRSGSGPVDGEAAS